MSKKPLTRAFKTAWFSKAARKARIGDPALLAAIREVIQGQADYLGGGVFKKRLNKNMHRSIVLGKGQAALGVCVSVRQEGPGQHR